MFFMWIKKKEKVGPREASGLSSQWHRVLPESSGSHACCSSPNMLGKEEERVSFLLFKKKKKKELQSLLCLLVHSVCVYV